VSPGQASAAAAFMAVLRAHLAGLFAALPAHVVTEISDSAGGGGGGRTSVVLKESFVDAFSPRDRAGARGWVETQLFAAAVDAVLD
jgi:hypothetical protein